MVPPVDNPRDALLLLTLTPGLGPILTRRLLDRFPNPIDIIIADARTLAEVEGIGITTARQTRGELDRLLSDGSLQREQDAIAQAGASLLAATDPDYPPLLKHISDPPAVLMVRGTIAKQDALALAIVGSRRCSAYGREQADRFAALAVQAGMTVVSGGAYGIDASAHRAALRLNGRTLAVLGSGLAKPYPTEHREMFDQIVAQGGAVVSELPMNAPPLPENFPRRNRIISGLSLGVLVVEAATRSGALITARVAAEEHHREVMAIPGRVDAPGSAGCHQLIRQGGATLVTHFAEVLDALGETGSILKAGLNEQSVADHTPATDLFTQGLSQTQRRIVETLEHEMPVDQIAAVTGLAVHTIQADLTVLQVRGVVGKSGMTWRKR